MILQSIVPIIRLDPADNVVRVIEWRNYKDEVTGKIKQESREYTITLYTRTGEEKEHSNRRTVDVRA